MWGVCQDSQAKTTRQRCPSDSCLMGAVWKEDRQIDIHMGSDGRKAKVKNKCERCTMQCWGTKLLGVHFELKGSVPD